MHVKAVLLVVGAAALNSGIAVVRAEDCNCNTEKAWQCDEGYVCMPPSTRYGTGTIGECDSGLSWHCGFTCDGVCWDTTKDPGASTA